MTSINLHKNLLTLGLLLTFVTVSAPTVEATQFSNVRLALLDVTPQDVDLFTNPGITYTAAPKVFFPLGNCASIIIDMSGPVPAGGDTLRLTVTATNSSGTTTITNPNPASLNIPINSSYIGQRISTGFVFPLPAQQMTTITVVLDLLKPSHKSIGNYYRELDQFLKLGVTHEMAVRDAFQSLLKTCASQTQLTLVPEYKIPRQERLTSNASCRASQWSRAYRTFRLSRALVNN